MQARAILQPATQSHEGEEDEVQGALGKRVPGSPPGSLTQCLPEIVFPSGSV